MTNILKQKLINIPKGVWVVSLANMLVAIATTIVFSVSPFFITLVLGLSMLSLGAMEGFTEALSQLTKLLSGLSADYFHKKKPSLLFGLLLAIIAKPFFILANGPLGVLTSKILERVSNGIIATPRDAYIADACDPSLRGGAYGIMMTGKTLGCIIGPLLVTLFMLFTENYRLILWIGFLPLIVAFLIIVLYMQEPNYKEQTDSQSPSEEQRMSLADIKSLSLKYWLIIIASAIFMLARFSDGFIALRLKELGAPLSICTATIAIFNFMSALCSFPVGYLSDKIGREKLLYFSYLSLILCNICFLYASDMWLGLVGVLLWGAQRGTSQILFTAIIADNTPKKIIGTSIGIFYIVTGISNLLASTISGWIANTGLTGIFIFGFLASTLALIVFCIMVYKFH